MTTSGTTVPLRPSKLEQVFHARFFSGKLPLELNKVQRLLLHYPTTSPLTWGTLVIQLRSKSNDPYYYFKREQGGATESILLAIYTDRYVNLQVANFIALPLRYRQVEVPI